MALEMKPVFSSHVSEIGYDPDTKELVVVYSKGKRGQATYEGVPEEVAARVVNAPSIGEALHQEIRGKYGHRYG